MKLYQVLVMVVVVALSEEADDQPRYGRVMGNVGGQDIPSGRWPWFAGLYEQENLFCSGSLISDQWVLTAACLTWVNLLDVTVVLGRTNTTGSNPNEVSLGINQTVCHPYFNNETFENNICLVKLSSPVELSEHITPVCLAAENSTFPNRTFSWIVATAIDAKQDLTELQFQILENNECQKHDLPITDKMICTTHEPPSEEETCLFAFGAPLLICNGDMVWIQLGISLYFEICNKFLSPSVYARVSSYQEWISHVIGSSQLCFVTFPSSGDDGVSNPTPSPLRLSTTPTLIPPKPNTVVPPRLSATPTVIPLRLNTTPTILPPNLNTTLTVVPLMLYKTPPLEPLRTKSSSREKLSSTFFTSISAPVFLLFVLVA